MKRAAMISGLSAACGGTPGGEPRTCSVDEISVILSCDAAQRFSARDSAAIRPTQDEVDIYFDRWSRAIAAEPVLADRYPQTYRNRQWAGIAVYTDNVTVIDAWRSRSLETGVPAIDWTVAQLHEPRLAPIVDQLSDSNIWHATIYVGGIYNEERVHQSLAGTGVWLDEPLRYSGDDGVWRWTGDDGTTAEIEFTFGWGDCFVNCTGYRTLLAVVPEVGDAVVYDAGGDPLPDHIQLSPSTLPL